MEIVGPIREIDAALPHAGFWETLDESADWPLDRCSPIFRATHAQVQPSRLGDRYGLTLRSVGAVRPKVRSQPLPLARFDMSSASAITAALDAGVSLRDVQEAASYADPRTTIRYDRARRSLDRHATYVVAAFVAGAAR